MKFKFLILCLIIFFSFYCGEKKEKNIQNIPETNGISYKEGDKYILKMGYKIGEKYNYSINSISESSQSAGEKTMDNKTNVLYKVSLETLSKDTTGDLDMKFRINSIKIAVDMGPQGSMTFDSENPADSSKMKNPFIMQQVVFLGIDFFARLNSRGEVNEVFKVDNIIKKILGPNPSKISDEQKKMLRISIENTLTGIIQQIFQLLPEKPVKVDSSWFRFSDDKIGGLLDIKNVGSYTLKNISNTSGSEIASISAGLSAESVGKRSFEEKGVKSEYDKPVINGSGTIEFDLGNGIVIRKNLTQSMNLSINITQGAKKMHVVTKAKTQNIVVMIK